MECYPGRKQNLKNKLNSVNTKITENVTVSETPHIFILKFTRSCG